MALRFYGRDPANPGKTCPAMFRDFETGGFYVQGKTVTDPEILKRIDAASPILDDETVVWLPARMTDIIRKACDDDLPEDHPGDQPPGTHL